MTALSHPGPPSEQIYRRRVRLLAALRELWQTRELLWTLTERELRARYKQAFLGFAWAVVTPLVLMVVFTLFKQVVDIDTGRVPYPLFAYLGALPWTYFSTSVSQGGQSLLQNVSLLNKVYCPRELFPLASVSVAAIDGLMSLVALGVLFVVFGFWPQVTMVWVPVLLVVQVAFTLGITLVVSSVIVYFRDLRHALPLLLQLGLFATPVLYGLNEIPRSLRTVYSLMNPLAPVIDGYRRTILLGQAPRWGLLAAGALGATLLLVGGYATFKHLETGFADVA